MAVVWRIICNLKRYYRVKDAVQRLKSSSSNRNMERHERDGIDDKCKMENKEEKEAKNDVEGSSLSNQIESDVINGKEN